MFIIKKKIIWQVLVGAVGAVFGGRCYIFEKMVESIVGKVFESPTPHRGSIEKMSTKKSAMEEMYAQNLTL